ncbi:hypothetical protein [Thiorhodovibrio frisius]|uniref:Uncharacterized protein n=1 Tax=Thiorhodovibrio frisius TaxID=631362 RepID=H8YWI5_9GAMM|nr:hypothetical protein [Thiorhodovibrio frisius]EIC22811.1 hypothetical protein Thi970DRAFT_00446 [Thiorhodovibrio frisius]WPL22932.1 hypothetical protein Thiofri_03110 [Thiorhodovibrio frisius]
MNGRHQAIGIKQVIRLDWMQRTANLLLAGVDAKSIRMELHEALNREADGQRSAQTRAFAVNNLMTIWCSADAELGPFRAAVLEILRQDPKSGLALHWAMISAAYPFWFNIARQTGRLLALQDQVTQAQIVARLKENYGDRQTVSRYARFVIRSFVDWGVLQDAPVKGCYEQSSPIAFDDRGLALLLYESALLASPEGKASLARLANEPAFFAFKLPLLSGGLLSESRARLDVVHGALDDQMLVRKPG